MSSHDDDTPDDDPRNSRTVRSPPPEHSFEDASEVTESYPPSGLPRDAIMPQGRVSTPDKMASMHLHSTGFEPSIPPAAEVPAWVAHIVTRFDQTAQAATLERRAIRDSVDELKTKLLPALEERLSVVESKRRTTPVIALTVGVIALVFSTCGLLLASHLYLSSIAHVVR